MGEHGTTTNLSENATVTAPASWTNYLPESFGIRENIRNSPFRLCVREVCVIVVCAYFLNTVCVSFMVTAVESL